MAESTIAVTAGAGTLLHSYTRTIGANTVHNEATVQAEPHLASYTIPSIANAASSTGTANAHLLQIMAGATLKVRIRRIEMYQTTLATTAAFMDVRIFRLTSAGTGGTAVGTSALDPADGASGATGIAGVGAKGAEGGQVGAGQPIMLQTIGASTVWQPGPIWVWDFDRPRSKPLIIAAGTSNGIAIKNITAVAAGAVAFMVWFDEATF